MSTSARTLFLLAVLGLTFLPFFVGGCGGGGGSTAGGGTVATSGASGPTQAPATARVVVSFPDVTRSRAPLSRSTRVDANQADVFRFYGLDAAGHVVFGPEDHARAAQVVLEAVPVAVVSLRVEFIQGSRVTGVVATPVALVAGSTVTVDNPDVPANAIASIQVTASRSSVAKGYSVALTAVGIFANGLRQDLTASVDWSTSNSAIASITTSGGSVQAWANDVGTATITAASSGVSGEATLTVTAAELLSVAITPSNPSVPAGLTQALTATATFSDHSTLDVTAQASWLSSDTNVATVTAGTLQAILSGTAVVTATLSGVSGTARVQVGSAILTGIAVTPPTPSFARGLTQQFTATGTFSDHSTLDLTEQVAWSSSAPGTVAVSNLAGTRGLASGVLVGQATITATSGGVSGSTLATVTAAVLRSVAVTPGNPSTPLGLTAQFTATGTFTDNTTQDLTASVTWTSSDPTIASVSNAGDHGLATPVKIGGPVTITATEPTTSKTGTTQLTVTDAVLQSIAVSPTNPSTPLGLTRQFTATGTYSDSTTKDITTSVTWTSSDPTVASVSNAADHGLSTPVKVGGPVTITATDPATTTAGTTQLTVTAAVLQSIAVTPVNPSTPLGVTEQFTATGTYSDNTTKDITTTVTWTSSDATIASISNASDHGLATPVKVGGPITVTATDPTTSRTGTTQFTVTAAVLRSLAVSPTNPSTPLGVTAQFTAMGTYSDSTVQDITSTVTWTSSDATIASISNAADHGLATPVKVGGPVTITATDPTTSKTGSTQLTVTAAVLQSIAVTPTNPSTPLGVTAQFTATGTYSDNTTKNITATVTWTSSDPTVASISNASDHGLATPVKVGGPLTITATDADTGKFGTTQLTVTEAALQSLAVSPTNPSAPLGVPTQFTATGTYSDNTTKNITATVTWTSSDPTVASVSNASDHGLATSLKVGGPITVTATDAATSKTGTTQFTVTAAVVQAIEVSPANSNAPLGLPVQFTVRARYTDNTTRDCANTSWWTSSDPNRISISNAINSFGIATGLRLGGPVTISAYDHVSQMTGSTQVTVTAATLQSLTVSPTTPSTPVDAPVQFTAMGRFSDNTSHDITSTVTWSSSDDAIATIDNATHHGRATPVQAGGPITVTATDPTTSKTASTTLTVTSAVLQSLTVYPASWSIPIGQTRAYSALGLYSDNTTHDITTIVTWSSSDPTIAAIDNAGTPGLATGVSAGGPVTITAIHPPTSKSGSTPVTVNSGTSPSGDFRGGSVLPVTTSGNSLYAVALGDFNRDGRLDMVVTDNSKKYWVILGDATLGFAAPVSYATTSVPYDVAVSDVDGDGVPDLILACDDGIHVLLGNGNGTFRAGSTFGVLAYFVAMADVNGDGRADLVVSENINVSTWLSQGDGTFTLAQRLPQEQTNPSRVAVADFNEDGKMDLVYALPCMSQVAVRPGAGDGTFGASQVLSTSPWPFSATTGDYNRDSHADFIVGTQVYLGQGNGTFATPTAFCTTEPGYTTTTDLNGDGKADLAALNGQTGLVSFQYGNGDGTFGPVSTSTGGNIPNRLAVGDLNGDGRPDVVITNQDGKLYLFPGDVNGIPEGPAATSVGGNTPLDFTQAIDFNGDGVLDSLVVDRYRQKAGVALGRGDGTFSAPTWLGTSGITDTSYARAGDVNGDGIPDIVTDWAGSVTVRLGVGNGTFQDPVTYSLSAPASDYGAGPLCLVDVNGDSKVDLVVMDTCNHKIQVLRGNGNGTFQASIGSSLGGTTSSPRSLVVADFNGDNVPDVAFDWGADCTARTLLGNGDGTFRAGGSHTVTPPAQQVIQSIATGDVNGDGLADLVALTTAGNVSVLLGNGDDTFQAPQLYATNGQVGSGSYGPCLRVADLNGDGRADVVACNQGSDTVAIFYSTSSGSLVTPQVYAIGGGPAAVDVADFNGDGHADILCANSRSNTLVILFHR